MGMSGNACYGSCLFWSSSPSLTKTAAPAERLVPCQADLHFLNCSSPVKMAPECIYKSHQNKGPWLSCHHPETKGQPASCCPGTAQSQLQAEYIWEWLWRNTGCDNCGGGEPSHNARDARHAEEIPQPGSFCSRCRMLFTGAWCSMSKPGVDLSQRGVAVRGVSRAPGTRSGFESTRSRRANTERGDSVTERRKELFVQSCMDCRDWAFKWTLALLYHKVFTFPV